MGTEAEAPARDQPAGGQPPGEQPGGGAPPARNVVVNPDDPIDMADYNNRWHKIWGEGLQPGKAFDAGKCSPLLLHLLATPDLPAAGAAVLVPGCGRGYDVLALARAGAARAVGLDISPEAVAAAAALRDESLGAAEVARAEFAAADFFDYAHPDGKFDIGYDYTFLCALPPQARRAWAEAWGRHLAPGGTLVTLIFPVDPAADPNAGPPFPVTPELYEGLLLPAGFERVKLEQVPAHLSHPQRAGREWLGIWRWPGGAASKF